MKFFILINLFIFLSLWNHPKLQASPTALFWTNCTTDMVSPGRCAMEVDNYFALFNRHNHLSFLSPDVGLELGIFTYKDISLEAGFDVIGGTKSPLFFNTKFGMEENKLFAHAPSWNIGAFGIGTKTGGHNRTNFNIIDIIFGKSLPKCIGGKVFIAGFSGSKAMGKNPQGFMLGYSRVFVTAKEDGKKYDKWTFVADYASGKNEIGGGGFGVTYNFTPHISVTTGPVWFNLGKINGSWKWTVQIYINFPVFKPSHGSNANNKNDEK